MHTFFYADDLVLLNENFSGLRGKLFRWKNVFVEIGLRIYIRYISF